MTATMDETRSVGSLTGVITLSTVISLSVLPLWHLGVIQGQKYYRFGTSMTEPRIIDA